ncbi:MAG: DUF3775 domain-containing protein [Sulfitobacter sp.]|nr:DUF3775 domain-containing protein [Sulfitobacter sp.]
MLDISNRKVTQIIEYGHEIERAENELRGFLETLNEEECYSLIAIMWIGRESFAPDEVQEALATARSEAMTPTADYLIGTPHFPDHLEAGLELLGLAEEEAD